MPRQIYFAVSPDPRIPNSHLTLDGYEGFYVKIGDGKPASAYSRACPSFHIEKNGTAPDYKIKSYVYDRIKRRKLLERNTLTGKALEYLFLKDDFGSQHSEWHFVTPGQFWPTPPPEDPTKPPAQSLRTTLESLRFLLLEASNTFAHCDFSDMSASLPMFPFAFMSEPWVRNMGCLTALYGVDDRAPRQFWTTWIAITCEDLELKI